MAKAYWITCYREVNDPAKLAAALITVADQHSPPLRWVAGADAIAAVEQKAKTLLEQIGVEPLGVELGRGPVRLDQPAPLRVLLAGDVAALLVAQLDAEPGREPLDGLGEAEVVDPLDELDDVAALSAGEAVPQAAGRGHVERGCFLVMKRA